MGSVDVVLPVKGAQNERVFTALVDAMITRKRLMLAKIVERVNGDPKLVALLPEIQGSQALLYLGQVPTAEDIRDYKFAPLMQSTDQ